MKKTNQTKTTNIRSMKDLNCQYCMDVHSGSSRDNCTCDGICRCSKITNTRIDSISISSIVDELKDKPSDYWNKEHPILDNVICTDIFNYCLERILVSLKLYQTSNWNVNITGGYYGEEIGSVTLNESLADTCDNWIKKLIKTKDNNDRIRLVLEAEYGYVLESLKYANFTLKEIDKSDIHFGQETYRKKVSLGDQEIYKNYTGICGICNCDNAKYILIDGYHRFCAVTTNKIKVLVF